MLEYSCGSIVCCAHNIVTSLTSWSRCSSLTSQSYGRNMLVYNVLGHVHLADEVRQFGCLDNVSAFPVEHFLQIFKKLIRKPNFALQQIINRLSEIGGKGIYNAAMQIEPLLKGEHSDGLQSAKKYKDLVISTAQGSNCTVRIADDFVMVCNILRDHGEIILCLVVENVCALLPICTRIQLHQVGLQFLKCVPLVAILT